MGGATGHNKTLPDRNKTSSIYIWNLLCWHHQTGLMKLTETLRSQTITVSCRLAKRYRACMWTHLFSCSPSLSRTHTHTQTHTDTSDHSRIQPSMRGQKKTLRIHLCSQPVSITMPMNKALFVFILPSHQGPHFMGSPTPWHWNTAKSYNSLILINFQSYIMWNCNIITSIPVCQDQKNWAFNCQ